MRENVRLVADPALHVAGTIDAPKLPTGVRLTSTDSAIETDTDAAGAFDVTLVAPDVEYTVWWTDPTSGHRRSLGTARAGEVGGVFPVR